MKPLIFNQHTTKPTTALSTANSPSTYTADPAIADVMRACERGITWRPDNGDPPVTVRLPTAPERAALDRRKETLAALLRPAAHDRTQMARAGAAVAEMLDGFTSLRNVDRSGLVAGFVADLQTLPAWAIERACLKVRRAEAGISLTFAPSTPEMFALARAELAVVKTEEERISATLRLAPKREPTEEDRRRPADKARAWLDRTDPQARQMATAATVQAPLNIDEFLGAHGVTREQFDALPDAPERAHG